MFKRKKNSRERHEIRIHATSYIILRITNNGRNGRKRLIINKEVGWFNERKTNNGGSAKWNLS